MAEKGRIYKCDICGNVVEVLHAGPGSLVCCNQEMRLLKENTTDAATEKHVPVIEKVEGGYLVKVGAVTHPMEEKHWIERIELETGTTSYRKFLKPGDKPEAYFRTDDTAVSAREYCNLHGLWKKEGV